LDEAAVAENQIDKGIVLAESLRLNAADVTALIALEAVSRLIAYGKADLGSVLNALATTAPRRAELLAFCNNRGLGPPPLAVTRFALAARACRAN
jgi:hypothetical protein